MGVVRQRLSFLFIWVVLFLLASFNYLLLAIVNYKLYICRVLIKNAVYNESGEDVSLDGYVLREGKDSLTTAYNMLCWCINNGYIKTN